MDKPDVRALAIEEKNMQTITTRWDLPESARREPNDETRARRFAGGEFFNSVMQAHEYQPLADGDIRLAGNLPISMSGLRRTEKQLSESDHDYRNSLLERNGHPIEAYAPAPLPRPHHKPIVPSGTGPHVKPNS